MKRSYYSDTISNFRSSTIPHVLGILAKNNTFDLEVKQKVAWNEEIEILKGVLDGYQGHILFEYSIPRMGKRIDVILIIQNVIFVLEFKVGEKDFLANYLDQVIDYCLDLKNFHETSQKHLIAPILIATRAEEIPFPIISTTPHNDNLLFPIRSNPISLGIIIKQILEFQTDEFIDFKSWESGRYSPTPTIIEAAKALYNHHSVSEIMRKDASAKNLSSTESALSEIILNAKNNKNKAICFVTGVPGAGKTLVGLDIATKRQAKDQNMHSVFLSGNGPLVAILREALTRDKVSRIKDAGGKIKKGQVMSEVKAFIQNVHHFRDECLIDEKNPPFDHIAIFDEAQRAWNHLQTASFMKRKKNVLEFTYSEPEFLISCMDRHNDWAVVICLVGGGQEINTGEAGISEWLESLNRSFPHWHIFISNRLSDSEYASGKSLEILKNHEIVIYREELHLGVSLRSFRAEHLSRMIKNILDFETVEAKKDYQNLKSKYPIALTRNLETAKNWLKRKARGTERYGIIVSSQAQRLKPHAIDVKSPVDPVHWFLDEKQDVRSSFYLEDVATEFHIQGLELDWSCVAWDADFRYSENEWGTYSFVGDKWFNIKKAERKKYLKNSYRVLLTRARQGMIIVVPDGDLGDPTRDPNYYDCTYNYLAEIGFEVL